MRVNIAVCTQTQRQAAYWGASQLHPLPHVALLARRQGHVYVLASAYIISSHSVGVWRACCAYPKLARAFAVRFVRFRFLSHARAEMRGTCADTATAFEVRFPRCQEIHRLCIAQNALALSLDGVIKIHTDANLWIFSLLIIFFCNHGVARYTNIIM